MIVINDGGTVPFDWDSLSKISDRVRVFHTTNRSGHSACRQLASTISTCEWLLFTDAHMEFEPRWFESFAIQTDLHDSKTLFCGPFISTTPEWEREGQPPNIFWGARLYYWERNGEALDVLSYKPIARPPEIDKVGWSFEVPCVIGANYFIRRDWFEAIDGLKCFYGWSAQDEFMLSLKTWLFGGTVKLIPDVRLRHVMHRTGVGPTGYSKTMQRGELLYNRLSTAYQIFPEHTYRPFLTALPTTGDDDTFELALRMITERREALDAARCYFTRNIRRGHEWLCKKFDLFHPLDLSAAQYMFAKPTSLSRSFAA